MIRRLSLRFATIPGMLVAASLLLTHPFAEEARAAAPPTTEPTNSETPPAETSASEAAAAESPVRTVEELTALVRKSVVVVSFEGRDGKQQGIGSGFVISDDGLIATNLHVLGEARPISVQLADGKKYPVKSIHATDRTMDLAVLRIDADHLDPLPLGDSDSLKQGEDVVALGSPQGLKFSVVRGVVSGWREIDGKPLIQLAMPIERGNSGGPMLDLQGRVHGVITLKSLVTRNLGFAVTINSLKPLLKKPNPVPMSRWLTIGAVDAADWNLLFGAEWRQRAGRIHVEGRGTGFGGRALALSKQKLPERPFEIGVEVKLSDEDGAAGLVFHSDGEHRHYGFYPSNGRLRFSRFDGADVFSWQVLKEIDSDHYRPGEWNALKVRLEKDRIICFLNDEPVIESTDGQYLEGEVGLAKFRDTQAMFRRFRVARSLPPTRPPAEVISRITEKVREIPTNRPPAPQLVDNLLADAEAASTVLEDRARLLEQQVIRLRQLARAVNEENARRELSELLTAPEDEIDLLHGALLIARIDNRELEVAAYLEAVKRIAEEIHKAIPADADESAKLVALDKHLFEELGFHGSRTDYYHRSNSYLNEVIDDREGLPITLSVLYIDLARRLGLKVTGVGLPGHFVVRFEPEKGESQLIDPFDRGARISRKEALEIIEGAVGSADEEFLAAQSKPDILRRMVHNLMGVARTERDVEAMLRYVQTLLAIDPADAEQRWFRAVLRYQTQRHDEALQDVEWLLDNQPAGVDLDQVRKLQQVLVNQAE